MRLPFPPECPVMSMSPKKAPALTPPAWPAAAVAVAGLAQFQSPPAVGGTEELRAPEGRRVRIWGWGPEAVGKGTEADATASPPGTTVGLMDGAPPVGREPVPRAEGGGG